MGHGKVSQGRERKPVQDTFTCRLLPWAAGV